MSLKFEKEKRRKIKQKVKKMNKKGSIEEFSPEKNSFKKENVIVVNSCFFFLFFLKDFVKFKNKLRTIEPRFLKKIKNNPASF